MLSGLISPSSGDAVIEGKKISTDMGLIRQSLGVCPQHDILFPELTVLQHLQMFATFKGVPASEVDNAAQKMIREVGLKEKTNVKSSMLSGGQKRKVAELFLLFLMDLAFSRYCPNWRFKDCYPR